MPLRETLLNLDYLFYRLEGARACGSRAGSTSSTTRGCTRATASTWGFDITFDRWPRFGLWVADHTTLTLTVVVAVEVTILLDLMARRIPAWIDNGYRHVSRADNLGSLRRVDAQTQQG